MVFLLFAFIFIFCALSLFTYSFMTMSTVGGLEGRMKSLLTPTTAAEAQAITEEVEKQEESPLLRALHILTRPLIPFIPAKLRKGARQRLVMAGVLPYIKDAEFVALQLIFLALGLFLWTPMVILLRGQSFTLQYVFTTLISFIVIIFPAYLLQRIIDRRQSYIRKTLPDVVDLLVVSVEAGAGFDGALMLVSDKMKGPLAQEFERSLQEMKLGKQRVYALRDMAARTGVPEVTSFVSAVSQADQLGVGMSQVLRLQTQVIRQRRLYQLRELAQKLPVKLYIPLVLFIFPTLLVVLMGPGVITIMHSLLR